MSNNLVKAKDYEEKRRNINKETFLQELNQFWDYDTSQMIYINMYEPFTLICKEHGPFEINKDYVSNRIKSYKKGYLLLPLCPECLKKLSLENNLSSRDKNIISHLLNSNNKKAFTQKDTENFIKRAKSIHGDKYDYSLTEYKGAHYKIKFICKSCGEIIEQQACDHLRTEGGCRKCNEKRSHEPRKVTEEQFWNKVLKFKEEKGWNFDFSNSVFKGVNEPITFICKEHGEIIKKANELYRGHGCRLCEATKQGAKTAKTTEQFIEDAKKIHGDYYDYSEVEYVNAFTKVKIIDPQYGPFWMVPNSHLNGQGYGKTSNGEKVIKHYLLQKGIYFEKEKTFSDLRSDKNKPLKFDIYIPSLNLCVEFQGEQHYKPVERFGGIEGLKRLQKNDQKKKEWCALPNHPDLLTIDYNEKIISKLDSYIKNRTTSISASL